MAINPYALCPCGSGKKIKFCCGDLAGEMEKVLRMVDGDQPAAAVRYLDQLLRKMPGRASLLDLKSNIEMQLGWYDQAAATVEAYLAADPESTNAWARRAMLMSLTGQVDEGSVALQRAISYCDDPPYNSVVLMAIRLVGQAFEEDDQIVSAIAHYLLYGDVSLAGDMDGEKELIRLTREAPIAELVKGPFKLCREPGDASIESEFSRSCLAVARGAWRGAVDGFESLKAKAAGDASVVYNAALLHGFLGETSQMVEGLREYAALGVPEGDAIEALALAQYLDPAQNEDLQDGMELVFEIDDVDGIVEKRAGNRRTPRIDRTEDDWDSDSQGPPPQACFAVLDRDDPREWDDLAIDDLPKLLATLEIFGRETDRPPRLVARIVKDDQYDFKVARVREYFELGDAEPASETTRVSMTPMGTFAMSYVYLPPETNSMTRVRIFEGSRLKALLDFWPTVPQQVLGGRSPADLVGDPAKKRDLQAAVFRVLQTQVPRRLRERAQAIWQKLELEPLPGGVDPETVTAERMWFVRVPRVDVAKLSDERLAKLTLDAALANATRTIAHLAPELLRRPQLHGTVNMYAVGSAAVGEAAEFSTAEAFLADARNLVSPEIVPPGLWNILEFEAAFDRIEEKRLAPLFGQAVRSAQESEVVGKAFVRAMSERGLITQDGVMRVPADVPTAAEPGVGGAEDEQEEPAAIWTPESEATKQGQGKIWLPS